eukprot:32610_5
MAEPWSFLYCSNAVFRSGTAIFDALRWVAGAEGALCSASDVVSLRATFEPLPLISGKVRFSAAPNFPLAAIPNPGPSTSPTPASSALTGLALSGPPSLPLRRSAVCTFVSLAFSSTSLCNPRTMTRNCINISR